MIKIAGPGVGGAIDHTRLPGNDEEDAFILRLRQYDRRVADIQVLAPQHQVDALARLDLDLRFGAGQRIDLLGIDAGGIDDMASTNSHFPVAQVIMDTDAIDFPVIRQEGRDLAVIGDGRTVLRGGTDESQGKASVVGLSIVVDEAFLQLLLYKLRSELQDLFPAQMAMAMDVPPTCQDIVEPEADIEQY